MPPRTVDGKLWIMCMRVGQGDCTIIICPTGEVFIVDVGSAEAELDPSDPTLEFTPAEPLNSAYLFGNNKRCAGLILSHWDRDHYNWVGLLADIGVKVAKVYHSGLFKFYGKGSKFGSGGKGNSLIERICRNGSDEPDYANIRGVSFTGGTKTFTTEKSNRLDAQDETPIAQGTGVDQYSTARGVLVHDSGGCRISLLCGNVADVSDTGPRAKKRRVDGTTNRYEAMNADARRINMASIVTLVEYSGKQYLICGDAVQETEEFVLATYPGLDDVEMLRVPHHGSDTHGSSHEAFAQRMNPKTLIVSAPRQSHSQPHPRCETISRYVDECPRLASPSTSRFGCFKTVRMVDRSRKKPRTLYVTQYDGASSAKARVLLTGWHDTIVSS